MKSCKIMIYSLLLLTVVSCNSSKKETMAVDTLQVERIFVGSTYYEDGTRHSSYYVASFVGNDTVYENLYNVHDLKEADSLLQAHNEETGFGQKMTIVTSPRMKNELEDYREIVKIIQ